jgi:hypothetical protein
VGRPLEEALSYYERARQESLKVGGTVNAALARLNMAEILTDRGEWAEAEAVCSTRCRSGKRRSFGSSWPPACRCSGVCRCAWAASTRR